MTTHPETGQSLHVAFLWAAGELAIESVTCIQSGGQGQEEAVEFASFKALLLAEARLHLQAARWSSIPPRELLAHRFHPPFPSKIDEKTPKMR